MPKKIQPSKPSEIPAPVKMPDVEPPDDPEQPFTPVEDPDSIPDEDPFETPPYEIPPPAEGP